MNAEPSIIEVVEAEPSIVFKTPEKLEAYLASLEAKEKDVEIDLSTDKGRKAIASRAFAMAKRKTAIETAGKGAKEDAQRIVDSIDALRKKARDRLDELRDRIRLPLDNWEKQEAARVAHCKSVLARLDSPINLYDLAALESDLAETLKIDVSEGELGDDYAQIGFARKQVRLQSLRDAIVAEKQRIAEREELARLRAEAAERERERQEAEWKREFRERIRNHIRQARIGLIDGRPYAFAVLIYELQTKIVPEIDQCDNPEELHEERLEAIRFLEESRDKEAAEAKAREQAEAAEAEQRRLREEMEPKDRAHQAELARVQAEAEAAERRRRQEEEAAERQRQAEAEAERKRQADVEHRGNIMRQAKEAIMEHGQIPEPKAKAIVLAITGGNIPNVAIKF